MKKLKSASKVRIASKTTLRNKLDKYWSEIIRSHGRCEVCGSDRFINAHHIIGRRNLHLRWDLKNGVCICSLCHTFGKNSAHQNPLWFMDWLDATRPQDLDYLRKQQQILAVNFDYEEKLEELRNVGLIVWR